jgi:hypothetical protein
MAGGMAAGMADCIASACGASTQVEGAAPMRAGLRCMRAGLVFRRWLFSQAAAVCREGLLLNKAGF